MDKKDIIAVNTHNKLASDHENVLVKNFSEVMKRRNPEMYKEMENIANEVKKKKDERKVKNMKNIPYLYERKFVKNAEAILRIFCYEFGMLTRMDPEEKNANLPIIFIKKLYLKHLSEKGVEYPMKEGTEIEKLVNPEELAKEIIDAAEKGGVFIHDITSKEKKECLNRIRQCFISPCQNGIYYGKTCKEGKGLNHFLTQDIDIKIKSFKGNMDEIRNTAEYKQIKYQQLVWRNQLKRKRV